MSRRRNRGDEPTLFDLPLDGPVEPADVEPPSSPEPSPESAAPPEPEPEPEPAREIPTSGRSAASRERPRLPFGPEPAAGPAAGPAVEPEPRRAPESEPAPGSGTGSKPAPRPQPEPAPSSGWSGAEIAPEPGFSPETGPVPPASEAPPLSVRYLSGLADLAIHAALAIALLFGARLLGVRADLGDWLPITLFLLVFSFFYTVLPLAFWGQTPGMAWAGVVARAGSGESLTFQQTALRWVGGIVTVGLVGLPVLLAIGGRRSLTDRLSDAETVLNDQG